MQYLKQLRRKLKLAEEKLINREHVESNKLFAVFGAIFVGIMLIGGLIVLSSLIAFLYILLLQVLI